jgi:hypothetical protein
VGEIDEDEEEGEEHPEGDVFGCVAARVLGAHGSGENRHMRQSLVKRCSGETSVDRRKPQVPFDKLRTGSSTASLAKCASDFAQDDTSFRR